jgi:hypothetical protein
MRRRMGLRLVTSLGVLLALGGPGAEAGLIGLTLDGQYYLPDSFTPIAAFSPESFVVSTGGPETTLDCCGLTITADFSNGGLVLGMTETFTTFTAAAFNGPIFKLTAGAPTLGITDWSVDQTTLAGFTKDDVTVSSTAIGLNFEGLTTNGTDTVVISFRTTTPAVPEPSTFSLLGAAALVLAASALR